MSKLAFTGNYSAIDDFLAQDHRHEKIALYGASSEQISAGHQANGEANQAPTGELVTNQRKGQRHSNSKKTSNKRLRHLASSK